MYSSGTKSHRERQCSTVTVAVSSLRKRSRYIVSRFNRTSKFQGNFAVRSGLVVDGVTKRVRFYALVSISTIRRLPQKNVTGHTTILRCMRLTGHRITAHHKTVRLRRVRGHLPRCVRIFVTRANSILDRLNKSMTIRAMRTVKSSRFITRNIIFLNNVHFHNSNSANSKCLLGTSQVSKTNRPRLCQPPRLTTQRAALSRYNRRHTGNTGIGRLITRVITRAPVRFKVNLLRDFSFFNRILTFGTNTSVFHLRHLTIRPVRHLPILSMSSPENLLTRNHLRVITSLALSTRVHHRTVANFGISSKRITKIQITIKVAILRVGRSNRVVAILSKFAIDRYSLPIHYYSY